jgi:hypothetical protein
MHFLTAEDQQMNKKRKYNFRLAIKNEHHHQGLAEFVIPLITTTVY